MTMTPPALLLLVRCTLAPGRPDRVLPRYGSKFACNHRVRVMADCARKGFTFVMIQYLSSIAVPLSGRVNVQRSTPKLQRLNFNASSSTYHLPECITRVYRTFLLYA